MQRTQFTFYESFFKAISRIKKKQDRAEAYDMICAYALYQIEPNLESVSDAVAIAFELLRPVLDKAKERAESGKKGGSKAEVNIKQTESKTETPAKLGETPSEKEKEKENENEVEIEKDNISPPEICGELPSSPPPAAVLPLVDGSDFPITQKTVDELSGLYPAVDVDQQLRNMRGWLLANPKNRKTKAGIMRFVNSWLSREQNQARPQIRQQSKGFTRDLDADEISALQRMLAEEDPLIRDNGP